MLNRFVAILLPLSALASGCIETAGSGYDYDVVADNVAPTDAATHLRGMVAVARDIHMKATANPLNAQLSIKLTRTGPSPTTIESGPAKSALDAAAQINTYLGPLVTQFEAGAGLTTISTSAEPAAVPPALPGPPNRKLTWTEANGQHVLELTGTR